MRPAFAALKSSSSKQWLARQASDPFVRARAGSASGPQKQYRARSSFKLQELARRFPILLRGRSIVDLGAAPGGWSQVAAGAMSRRGAVVAVDLLPIEPLKGVEVITGDFFDPEVQERVRALLVNTGSMKRKHTKVHDEANGFTSENAEPSVATDLVSTGAASEPVADTVLSDMMAAMSGVRVRDVQASLDLCAAATEFAHGVLRPVTEEHGGGSLVLKFFLHPDLLAFRKESLDPYFTRVVTDKPKSSRSESSEAYWVCLGYKGRPQD